MAPPPRTPSNLSRTFFLDVYDECVSRHYHHSKPHPVWFRNFDYRTEPVVSGMTSKEVHTRKVEKTPRLPNRSDSATKYADMFLRSIPEVR